MDMNEAVAKAIAAERTIADMTVRELAKASGIPERSLMRILQSERDIKANQIAALADAMKLYPHEIIEHAEVILDRDARQTPTLTPVFDGPRIGNVPTSFDDLERRPPRTQDRDKVAAADVEPRETDQLAPGEHPHDD